MTFELGENVGPYRITERLGQGGMATVYRAYHANLDRYVAIKVLHAAFKEDPNFLARFQREAQIVAKLEHPSIVPIYDYDDHNGEPYLVMKFIDGVTLKARLTSKPLTLEETLTTMTSVAQALTYAHEQGVLHRDIKPSNILLEKNTTPYIADFGLARIASAGESTLSQESMLGTPIYMSPEQAQGVKDLTSATDIYSLGVVLYELVVGRVPFNADTPYAIIHDHIYTPLPLPTKVNPQVPQAVERVLLKALAKDRKDRYSSAVEMVEGFRQAVRESDLKELSAASYRVPMPAGQTYTPPNVPGVPAGTSTNVDVGVPYPMQSYTQSSTFSGNVTGPAAEAYAKFSRRRNLWMLFGFGLLVLTCLGGLFIALSTYAAANNAGLFAPGRIAGVATQPTEIGTTSATTEATTASTTSATFAATTAATEAVIATTVATTEAPTVPPAAATEQATAAAAITAATATTPPTIAPPTIAPTTEPPTVVAVAVTPTPINPADPFPILTLDEAQALVVAYPNDVRARLELALALSRENRPALAQSAFGNAVTLMNGDTKLAMEIGHSMIMRPGLSTSVFPSLLYALAYSYAADTGDTVRSDAGQIMYTFAVTSRSSRNGGGVRLLGDVIGDLHGSVANMAGLYSFAALAYHNAGEDRLSKLALDKATSLSEHLPEVLLVKGIIEKDLNDNVSAQIDLLAASKAASAPAWVTSEAKRLAQ